MFGLYVLVFIIKQNEPQNQLKFYVFEVIQKNITFVTFFSKKIDICTYTTL